MGESVALQRTSNAPAERYRIQVIDRAAQILDCFGFDHQELSVGEIGAETCVGAPIRDHTGAMVGAISAAAPLARLTEKKIPPVGRLVMAVAEEISEQLGYEKTVKVKTQ